MSAQESLVALNVFDVTLLVRDPIGGEPRERVWRVEATDEDAAAGVAVREFESRCAPKRIVSITGVTLSEAKRIFVLEHTITERYYYDPDEIRRVFGGDDPEKPLDDLVIETFELHDGSVYADRFFYNDANPQVGIDLVTGWDDD